jgi:hypothetical protein
MSDRLLYVYGFVSPGTAIEHAPAGLDGEPIALEREGPIAALVSQLDAARYAPTEVEARVADIEWVGPRAVAHDEVLTWASDAGGVIPLPMFTLFSSAEALHELLRTRGDAMRATLARVAPCQELGVRVFRDDAVLGAHLAELSPAVAEIERAARAATPGQRYLLERKAEGERRKELRRVGSEAAAEIHDALSARSLEATRDPLPSGGGGKESAAAAVLNAAYLVPRDSVAHFREALAQLSSRFEPRGFRFELTGPWPPYHFVREGS